MYNPEAERQGYLLKTKNPLSAGLITGFVSAFKITMALSGLVVLNYLPKGGATGKVLLSPLP